VVVRAAVDLGLEDGAKLRVDTTVVQTDIHHPTDNTLLWDVVRVVTRLVRRLAKALELRRIKGFCDRTRSARRRMYEIQRMTTRQRHEQQTHTYRMLIDIAEEVVGNARAGLERTRTMRGKDMFTDLAIEELRGQIEHFCGLGDRVIDQARRRVSPTRQFSKSAGCRRPRPSSPTRSIRASCRIARAQGRCGVERVLGDVSRAVVGQPFDGMRRLADPESTTLRPHGIAPLDRGVGRLEVTPKPSRFYYRLWAPIEARTGSDRDHHRDPDAAQIVRRV
jgi:hypothetical protein